MSETESSGNAAWVTLIITLITVLGGLATLYMQNQPQQTALALTATADARYFNLTLQALTATTHNPPTIIVVTATPQPATPTHTASPPTVTPTRTATAMPLPGEDLESGCISTAIWQKSTNAPIPEENGCWYADEVGIFAHNGLVYSIHQPHIKVVSFYTPVSEYTDINFFITIKDMRDKVDNAQIDLFFGFSAPNNGPANGDFVILRKSANSDRIYVLHGNSAAGAVQDSYGRYIGGHTLPITIQRRGNFISVYVDGKPWLVDRPVPRSQLGDAFWFGYSIPHNSDVEATITHFLITPAEE